MMLRRSAANSTAFVVGRGERGRGATDPTIRLRTGVKVGPGGYLVMQTA